MQIYSGRAGTLTVSALAVLMTHAACAADDSAGVAGAGGLDEIVVTAQRRDESLSKTPVSVDVLSSTQLAQAQIVTEQDLRAATPGLSVRAGLSSNQLNYSMRGQSQDAFSGTRPGVLPYINEVQIGGSGGSTAFYDLDSVQVLKGPQGTLFGRSATGGAVLFTTAKPTDAFGGYVSATGGDYGTQKYEAAINGPMLGDVLLGRLAGFYQQRDGFQYNQYDGGREGDFERYGFRGSLIANLGEHIHNDFVFDFYHYDGGNTEGIIAGLLPFNGGGPGNPPYIPVQYLYAGTASPAATAAGISTLQAFTGVPAAVATAYYNAYFANPKHPTEGISAYLAQQFAQGPYVINTDADNLFHTRNIVVTNATTVDVAQDTQIKNILGYVGQDTFKAFEADGTPYGISSNGSKGTDTGFASPSRQLSEELQLNGKALDHRLNYVTGLYFSNENASTVEQSTLFDILFGGEHQVNAFQITNKTYSAYGQGTYALNDDGLSVTGGLRYTHETVGKITMPDDSIRQALGVTAAPLGYSYEQSSLYSRVSWQVGIQDQLNPDTLVYLVSRRAYKSGGFNGTVAPVVGYAANGGDAYLAESVTDVELGAKFQGSLFDMPTRTTIAVYNDWVQNRQTAAFTLVGAEPAALTVNVPHSDTWGIELDAAVKPFTPLTVGGNVNLTRARFSSDAVSVNGSSQIFDQVPDTPEFTGTVYADFTQAITPDLSGHVHADVYDQQRSFTSPQAQNSAGTTLPCFTLTNFRVGVDSAKGNWSVTANLKNAFNRLYYVGGLPVGEIYQINTLVPGEPRTYTVEGRLKF